MGEAVKATDGKGLTVIVMEAISVQPEVAIPVAVYVVVRLGLAATVAPIVGVNPVAGDQTYEEAPLAVIVVPDPIQMALLGETTLTTGCVPILTVMVEVAVHPLTSEALTVYVVVVLTVTVTLLPVVGEIPPEGAHR